MAGPASLLSLIEQCLSNVASRRPDAAEVVRQLLVERDRVPSRPENRLELFQQLQSLRAELQKCSREEVEALRGEVKTLRREIESVQAEKDASRAGWQSLVESLRAELALREERSRAETESLPALWREVETLRREIESVRAEKDADMVSAATSQAGWQSLVESLRAELALRDKRSRAETESLRAQVQRLTMQPRTTPPQASIVQVSVHYCHWIT